MIPVLYCTVKVYRPSFDQNIVPFLEDDVVDVLAEEVEQEPVTHPGLVHHNLNKIH